MQISYFYRLKGSFQVRVGIINKIKDQFPQRFWEMYLATSLRKAGLNLERKEKAMGPDIMILHDDKKTWIEATMAFPGEGNDAVKEQTEKVRDVPDDKIKLRLTNSFSGKFEKYKKYREEGTICSKDPFIIAINASQIPLARKEQQIPRIVRALLPFGHLAIHIDINTGKKVKEEYEYQDEIIKESKNSVKTDHFLNEEYSGISGVIYSHVDVHNCREIGEDLLLLHNPLSTNPIPLGFLKIGVEYWLDQSILKHS